MNEELILCATPELQGGSQGRWWAYTVQAVVTTSPYFVRKQMKNIVDVHFTDKLNINSSVSYKRGKTLPLLHFLRCRSEQQQYK